MKRSWRKAWPQVKLLKLEAKVPSSNKTQLVRKMLRWEENNRKLCLYIIYWFWQFALFKTNIQAVAHSTVGDL